MKMYMKTIILTILFALLTMGVAGQNTDNLSEKSETETPYGEEFPKP